MQGNLTENETWWQDNCSKPQVMSWSGLSFERVCESHIKQIKSALGISGVATEISAWQKSKDENGNGAQVDLIIKRADRMVHLCEMKFATGMYTLTADYEELLRNRQSVFTQSTQTNLTIVHTFVTTYGVKDGMHKGIVHSEVTMEDLFRE